MRSAVKRVVAMLAAWAMLAAGAAWARDAEPVMRIPLRPMGYQTMLPEFLLGGSSMLTVHFVDADHLLVTFGLRGLMKREPGDPADDDDRMVGAALVELPSGKMLAKTEWRMHDRGQYLWALGHGRFLLRVRDRLTVIAPMAAGGAKDAFRETPLLHIERHIVALMVSANQDLLTVETTKRVGAETGDVGVGAGSSGDSMLHDSAPAEAVPVQLNFYRLMSTGAGADGLRAAPAGAIRAHTALELPMTTGGFLDVIEGGKDRWLFNFDAHTGKVSELAEFDTTCFPRATFVGHGEFVAFGCMGSMEKQALGGFNLKGEEMWQQSIGADVSPTFSFAPVAGRFALGRIVVTVAVDEEAPLLEGMVSADEVRVVQSYDGRVLFKIDCTPVERAGQNFALSADGMRLAVVRETLVHHAATNDYDEYSEREAAVEVYALPPLTEKDQAEVKAAEAMAPQDTGARIDLSLERVSTPLAVEEASGAGAASEDTSAPAAAVATAGAVGEQGAAVAQGSVVLGDPEPGAGRKRPTLYGPDETPGSSSR